MLSCCFRVVTVLLSCRSLLVGRRRQVGCCCCRTAVVSSSLPSTRRSLSLSGRPVVVTVVVVSLSFRSLSRRSLSRQSVPLSRRSGGCCLVLVSRSFRPLSCRCRLVVVSVCSFVSISFGVVAPLSSCHCHFGRCRVGRCRCLVGQVVVVWFSCRDRFSYCRVNSLLCRSSLSRRQSRIGRCRCRINQVVVMSWSCRLLSCRFPDFAHHVGRLNCCDFLSSPI